MAGYLKVTDSEMAAAASKFDQESAEVENLNQTITRLVENLTTNVWEGAGSEAFAAQWQQISPSFTKASQLLADVANQLRNISNAYAQQDQDIASRLMV
jgi:WXG100 family type VII secretion target